MAPRGAATAPDKSYTFEAPFRVPPERRSTRVVRQAVSTTATNTSPYSHASPHNDLNPHKPQRKENGTKEAQHSGLNGSNEEDAYLAGLGVDPEEEGHLEEDDYDEGDEESADDGTTFRSRPKLPQSVVTTQKLGDLINLLDSPWLDLNPEYQRDVVWSIQGMSGLINSLIEDYYIPPIIFNLEIVEIEDGSERWKRICVDGKQRLSSIKAFVMGIIPCTDKYGKKWYYTDRSDDDGALVSRIRHRVLSNEVKRVFRNKSLICYEYKNLTPDQEEDLFARVQKGVQLTPAEKLRATNGPWQALAKRFEADFNTVVNLAVNHRSSGFRHMLSAFAQIIETQHPSNANGSPQFRIQISAIALMCNKNAKACDEATKSHLSRVFATFQDLVVSSPETFRNNNYKVARKFSPVELIATAVLISKYFDSRNNELLLGDIRHMRESIRQALPDLRLDAITWKTVSQYVYELESYRGATDGSNIVRKTFRTDGRFARATHPTPAPAPVPEDQKLPRLDTDMANVRHTPSTATSSSTGASPATCRIPLSATSSRTSICESPQPGVSQISSARLLDPKLGKQNESPYISSEGAGQAPVAAMATVNRTSRYAIADFHNTIKPEPVEGNFQPPTSTTSKRRPGLEIGAAGAAAREFAEKRRKLAHMHNGPVQS